ncbi:hypothetical protein EV198_1542 [Roseivirga ehrenbergii]|uniref:Uncharacterized protein n=1 Tax=Roseivirga ehrenbergii (strain DSM 102268 / JCM 13514 / KCTC 12282 / NCIMB 14502 / KMM 6017) TaxID=279360 RepID=A0A150XRK0_ROSEK|nr:hypothetical protein [Roseivirga ehrenbergii]KYG81370.1 hypothetical protein MB14_12285 [Roseivirga ehrenbergii]TCL10512.1 hypothetical protein EV198_1542 [Roseivirga ehrenbergii]
MKPLNVIYKYGHFYDTKTNQRVLIKDGEELVLVVRSDAALLQNDPLNEIHKPRTAKEIEQDIERLDHFQWHKKILSKGDKLYFTINSQILTSDDQEKIKVTFETELLEDLYYYKTTSVSLASCNCIVNRIVAGNLLFFESINAGSLNEAHNRTFVHYFSKYGQGTSQANSKFKLPNGEKLVTLMTRK